MSKLFEDLMDSAQEIDSWLKGKKIQEITVKTVEVEPVADFSAKDIKKIRAKLKLSQSVLAQIIGVSAKAVQAWEAGTNQPTGPAARMIDLLARKPRELVEYYVRTT